MRSKILRSQIKSDKTGVQQLTVACSESSRRHGKDLLADSPAIHSQGWREAEGSGCTHARTASGLAPPLWGFLGWPWCLCRGNPRWTHGNLSFGKREATSQRTRQVLLAPSSLPAQKTLLSLYTLLGIPRSHLHASGPTPRGAWQRLSFLITQLPKGFFLPTNGCNFCWGETRAEAADSSTNQSFVRVSAVPPPSIPAVTGRDIALPSLRCHQSFQHASPGEMLLQMCGPAPAVRAARLTCPIPLHPQHRLHCPAAHPGTDIHLFTNIYFANHLFNNFFVLFSVAE